MALYLVVANQTSASPELIAKLQELAAADAAAEFVLLVPATPTKHLLTWEAGDTSEITERRASESTALMRRSGLSVAETIVGPADPLQAVREEIERKGDAYALTIVGMLPSGFSQWLKRDLPNQLRRQLGIEVISVVTRMNAGLAVVPRIADVSLDEKVEASSLNLKALAAWRRTDLYCSDGRIGQIEEIVYDYMTQQPLWFGIESHPLPFRTLLAPVSAAWIIDGRLITNLTRERVLAQPPALIGEGFSSLTDEEHLYEYYGLPFSELRDVRVLRAGEPLPGSERNEQSILASEGQAAG